MPITGGVVVLIYDCLHLHNIVLNLGDPFLVESFLSQFQEVTRAKNLTISGGVAVHTSAFTVTVQNTKNSVVEGTAILVNYFPNNQIPKQESLWKIALNNFDTKIMKVVQATHNRGDVRCGMSRGIQCSCMSLMSVC